MLVTAASAGKIALIVLVCVVMGVLAVFRFWYINVKRRRSRRDPP